MAVTRQQIILEVDADTSQVTKSLDSVESSVEDTSKATDGLTNSLDKMTGGAVTGFKNMATGIKTGVAGLKTFKVALASTGIGLIVVAERSSRTFKTPKKGPSNCKSQRQHWGRHLTSSKTVSAR